jgi:hypothetical protein
LVHSQQEMRIQKAKFFQDNQLQQYNRLVKFRKQTLKVNHWIITHLFQILVRYLLKYLLDLVCRLKISLIHLNSLMILWRNLLTLIHLRDLSPKLYLKEWSLIILARNKKLLEKLKKQLKAKHVTMHFQANLKLSK